MPENQNNSVDTELATENSQADVETSETAAPAAGSAPEFTEAPANVEAPAAEAAPQADTKNEAKTEATSAPAKDEDAEDEGVKFVDLGIDGRVLAALQDVGYEKPSPIQAATIPLLLEGRDVVGLAQTGTGKTAAFAVPALSRLAELHDLNGPSRKTQALVLAPTRELALQVAEAFTSYAKHIDDFTVLPVYGGSAYGPQLAGLRRGAQVVVGTPGRVIDHIAKGSLDLSELQYLVLDEADEMLRMGFAEDVEQIFQQTPAGRQVALFSATMPSQIRRLSKQYLNNPAEVQVKSKTTTGANTRQRYLQVMGPHKLDALTRILEVEEFEGVIAFVRTKMATEDLADKLRSRGFQAAAINGDIPQQQRERTVEALRDGKIDILVATDVAARGLDVERVSHVVNYDIPHDTESYVHRIGRTGRAGRSGDAILFMTPREKYLLRSIEKATRQPVEQMHLPTAETVNTLRLGKFAERITETLASEDVAAFRDLIASYEEEHNVPAAGDRRRTGRHGPGRTAAPGQGTAGRARVPEARALQGRLRLTRADPHPDRGQRHLPDRRRTPPARHAGFHRWRHCQRRRHLLGPDRRHRHPLGPLPRGAPGGPERRSAEGPVPHPDRWRADPPRARQRPQARR